MSDNVHERILRLPRTCGDRYCALCGSRHLALRGWRCYEWPGLVLPETEQGFLRLPECLLAEVASR